LNYGKEELKYEKAGKITSQGALRIDTAFLKKPEKSRAVWISFWLFSKAKTL
jgi:hypothetical protein